MLASLSAHDLTLIILSGVIYFSLGNLHLATAFAGDNLDSIIGKELLELVLTDLLLLGVGDDRLGLNLGDPHVANWALQLNLILESIESGLSEAVVVHHMEALG